MPGLNLFILRGTIARAAEYHLADVRTNVFQSDELALPKIYRPPWAGSFICIYNVNGSLADAPSGSLIKDNRRRRRFAARRAGSVNERELVRSQLSQFSRLSLADVACEKFAVPRYSTAGAPSHRRRLELSRATPENGKLSGRSRKFRASLPFVICLTPNSFSARSEHAKTRELKFAIIADSCASIQFCREARSYDYYFRFSRVTLLGV